jgi:hypothetical protein
LNGQINAAVFQLFKNASIQLRLFYADLAAVRGAGRLKQIVII